MIDEQQIGVLNRLGYRPEESNGPENRAIGAMVASLRWDGVPDEIVYEAATRAFACVADRAPVPWRREIREWPPAQG